MLDTYVDSARKDQSFSSAPKLRGDGSPQTQIFLRFQVRPGASVRRAVLRLFVLEDADRGGIVHRVDQLWDAGVTWNTRPLVLGPALGEIGLAVTGRYVEIDVTNAVHSDGSVNLTIIPTSLQDVEYAASEGEGNHGPSLIVER
ncbi:MAG: DNRLRE domain-containing protein [Chloroflexales bacterium]|nr:DNRLRE domain-containing protein [Chloroflexales bacterium]